MKWWKHFETVFLPKDHTTYVEKFKSDYNKEVARKLEKQKKQEKRKLRGGAQPKNKRRKLGKS